MCARHSVPRAQGRRVTAGVLLECTNMAPYARALSDHLRLPVYDMISFVAWFHAGLKPHDFGHPASTRAHGGKQNK